MLDTHNYIYDWYGDEYRDELWRWIMKMNYEDEYRVKFPGFIKKYIKNW